MPGIPPLVGYAGMINCLRANIDLTGSLAEGIAEYQCMPLHFARARDDIYGIFNC